jgi:pseudomonalisin
LRYTRTTLFAAVALSAAAAATGMAAAGTPAHATGGWAATDTRALTFAPTRGTVTGRLAGSHPLFLSLALAPRNAAALKAGIAAEYTPGANRYKHYLTPARYKAAFAPRAAEVSAVTHYLDARGFRSVTVSADRLEVSFTGTAAQAERAFDTRLVTLRAKGHTVFVNSTAARVPAALGGVVQAVLGLNDIPLQMPLVHGQRTPAATPDLTDGIEPTGFQKVYDATGTKTGAGTSIAVIAEGDLTQVVKDLHTEETDEKVPQIQPTIVQVGPASSDTSGEDEWDLDTQSSTGMAGTVKHLYVYDGPSLTDSALTVEVTRFASDDKAQIGSASLGGCDALSFLDGSQVSTDNALEQAVAQGQSFFASSGDTGAACSLGLLPNGVPDGGAAGMVEYPADGFWTTGVGGTSLVVDSSYNRIAEIAWNAGGGGVSYLESPPAWTDNANPLAAEGVRGVPDIAMSADPNSGGGADIIVDGSEEEVGGTSLSSPLAMGSWARVESAHGNTLGDIAPDIYGLYNKANPGITNGAPPTAVPGLSDITVGTNGLYTATPGYDFTTGLGTLDVAQLDQAL